MRQVSRWAVVHAKRAILFIEHEGPLNRNEVAAGPVLESEHLVVEFVIVNPCDAPAASSHVLVGAP